jgi:peptidoglycan/LPS O-acetylase OafA/YrhL
MHKIDEQRISYIPSLDGIRAFSIISVILYHSFPSYFPGGWAGVDIFFVLSGYLITLTIKNDIYIIDISYIKQFYLKRAVRIIPPFFAMVFIMFPISIIFNVQAGEYLRAALVSISFMMNWNRAFNLWPQSVLAHSWSLSIEEQFYLIWPIIIIFLRRRSYYHWLGAALLAVFLWRCFLVFLGEPFERTYNGFDTHADGLLIGGAIALIGASDRFIEKISYFSVFYILAISIIILSVPLNSVIAQTFGFLCVSLLGALLIISSQKSPILSMLFCNPIASYLGKISYGLYIWHYPLLILFINNVDRMYVIIYIIPTLLCSAVSFHFLEKPILRNRAWIISNHKWISSRQ